MTPATNSPLLLDPLLRHYRFGGHALARWGKVVAPGGAAESWEVSSYPGLASRIRHPAGLDLTLAEIARARPDEFALPGRAGFPFLLKLLDVAGDLPVHVHPSNAQARELRGPDPGKAEAWLVLEADPDAVVYLGFLPGVAATDVRRLAPLGRLTEAMQPFSVRAGQAVLVAPGTAHAGRGIVFLEVQQVSDRSIFADPMDVWGNPWPPGRLEAEIEAFLAIADLAVAAAGPTDPAPLGAGRALAAVCPHFCLERLSVPDGRYLPRAGPVSLTNLGGALRLVQDRHVLDLGHGQSAVLARSLTTAPWRVEAAAPPDLAEASVTEPATIRLEAEAADGGVRLAPLWRDRF